MTAPTNDSQTSERERLADSLDASAGNPALPKWMHAKCSDAAAQLRAAEAELAALRAENEALRTVVEGKIQVTEEDVIRTSARTGVMPADVRKALQSFIRSKEVRRG